MPRIVSVSEARSSLASLVEAVATGKRKRVRIRGDAGDVVVVSREEWESVQETLHLLSVPGLIETIRPAPTTKSMVRGSSKAPPRGRKERGRLSRS